jgi:NAD(P)-dependent dehydrogenase (short-subunit alcohol dehydrogenase family)
MRWILVTGCSSGIGRHAAFALQQRGYQVIASARSERDVESLQAQGLRQVIQLDLCDSQSIQSAVKQAQQISGGKLSALFNNGAYGQPGAVEDLSRDILRQQFEANFFGTVELTNLLIPDFLKQPDARIVQNSSVLGFVAMKFRGAYNASKFALEGITDTMRLELAGTSIKVVLIEPGAIETQFRANALAAFDSGIDRQNSRFKTTYEKMLERLSADKSTAPFTLGPEAVTRELIRALESRNPKVRYRVTKATKILAVMHRLLPTRWLDGIVRKY